MLSKYTRVVWLTDGISGNVLDIILRLNRLLLWYTWKGGQQIHGKSMGCMHTLW